MDCTTLLAKYGQPVPRYTSYPTAPHFSAAVTDADYERWLRDIPGETAVSLYLHVPFCASLCLFCACHTTVATRPEPLAAYAETLRAEVDLVADRIGRRLPVAHVHWGGGTPTSLPPDAMRAVMDRLRARFAFDATAEIAVEVDPRTCSAETVETLAAIGVNRVSLGVQDFDPAVQQAIRRHQSFDLTARCIQDLRSAGIGSVNLDLIYGLPHQTTDGVRHTIAQALQPRPDRVAVFGYAHVPWMKKHQALIPEAALPGALDRFVQCEAAGETILAAGYRAVGHDHFALPADSLAMAAATGRLRRNFQGYTTDGATVLIGFGASSIGSMPDGYVQNHAAVPAWRDSVRSGRLPLARGVALTHDDRLRRAVIERIMCDFAVDLHAVAARFDADPADLMDAAPALQVMARDGLLEWDGYALSLTPTGRPFVRSVAATFDARARTAAARHSAAV
ncbi:MAG: oxygen-independent coproporphyrinogen III oxidase [Acetobacteraceae bacterium]